MVSKECASAGSKNKGRVEVHTVAAQNLHTATR